MNGYRTNGRRIASILMTLGVLASAACLTFRRPEVAFRGVELRSIGSQGADLEAAFDVTNPNGYRIVVDRLTYRITVNGRDAGGGAIETATELPKQTTTPVRLPLTLDWTKLKAAGLDALMGGIDYAVEGEITFSTPFGKRTRPYRHVGRYGGVAD